MKKSIILLFTLCAMVMIVNAQNEAMDTREKLTFGGKIGLNIANVWDAQGQEFTADSKLGFAGGAFLSIPIGKYLGFQPEVLLSQKGFQGSGVLLLTPYSFTRTTTYIDIPLQLQFKPSEFIYILLGPQYSYLTRQRDVYTLGKNATDQEQEFKNENIRKNILGFVIGLDVNVKHIVISGRSGWDFQTNNGNGTSQTPRYKNQWLQLTIGAKI